MEALITQLCTQHGKLKDSDLNTLISQKAEYSITEKIEAINILLSKGKITISEDSGEVVYEALAEHHASTMKKLEGQEILILQMVRESGTKGTWNGEIKAKTAIPVIQINKILTNLQKQGLVFSQKSVSINKKMWFLEGMKPNNETTGGFLFAEEGFDNSLMSELCSQIKALLAERPATIKEVLEYVKLNVNKHVNEENIKEVVGSMIALREIDEFGGKIKLASKFSFNPLVAPCFACNLRAECRADGIINPADCEYLNTWLDF